MAYRISPHPERSRRTESVPAVVLAGLRAGQRLGGGGSVMLDAAGQHDVLELAADGVLEVFVGPEHGRPGASLARLGEELVARDLVVLAGEMHRLLQGIVGGAHVRRALI